MWRVSYWCQGRALYFPYYTYVRSHPINTWNYKTFILRGENGTLCEYDYVKKFADNFNCELTEQNGGEHWFHTDFELDFFRNWIRERLNWGLVLIWSTDASVIKKCGGILTETIKGSEKITNHYYEINFWKSVNISDEQFAGTVRKIGIELAQRKSFIKSTRKVIKETTKYL